MKKKLFAATAAITLFSIYFILVGQGPSDDLLCNHRDIINKFSCMVNIAAEGIKPSLVANNSKTIEEEINSYKAVEAMNLIQNWGSSARYSHLKRSNNKLLESLKANQPALLTSGYGLCGDHQYYFIEVLKRSGLEARPVDFYYIDEAGNRQNHAAAEVKIGVKWAYFDVTWGSFWLEKTDDMRTLLSLEEIREGKGTRMGGNNSWYLQVISHRTIASQRNPFAYLPAKDLQILRNKGGLLQMEIKNEKIDFSNVPNYIGRRNNDESALQIELTGNFLPSDAEMIVSSVGGRCQNAIIRIGSNTYPVVKDKTKIRITSNSVLKIESAEDDCYAVIKSLELLKKNGQ